ncbi:uncharacterized protein DEA37_0013350 [Paragonimus westermani]|uniref:Reverse transcriptase RNase H-like domain-containing protein n=1 Tax=Paragonimus westermani TaxID=34504 RepID=A0A5J4N869_9TREM|nr:uncharacterized protein DEA37_0013350 [Paragonimus westermani]
MIIPTCNWKPSGAAHKFHRPWLGPFVIVHVRSPTVYVIRDTTNPTEDVLTVHYNQLKPVQTPEEAQMWLLPVPPGSVPIAEQTVEIPAEGGCSNIGGADALGSFFGDAAVEQFRASGVALDSPPEVIWETPRTLFGRTELAPVHRERFHARRQQPSESVDSFLPDLLELALKAFPRSSPAERDCQICERSCLGLYNQELLGKFLHKPASSPIQAVEKARAFEAVQESMHDTPSVASPLHQLTEEGKKFVRSAECHAAFNTLEDKLSSPPILAFSDFSPSAGLFILDTDASDLAIGAALSQRSANGEVVIAYARRYCTTRRKMLALVYFLEHFRPYLLGIPFKVRTDHQVLQWLHNFRKPEGQVARWLEYLQDYDFDCIYHPSSLHANADALTRFRGNC